MTQFRANETFRRASDVVVLGTQDYFEKIRSRLDQRAPFTHVIPDGPISDETAAKYHVLSNVKEIEQFENPLVLVARTSPQRIVRAVNEVNDAGGVGDFAGFYAELTRDVSVLKALDRLDYTDMCENRIVLDPAVPSRLRISIEDPKTSCRNTVIVGRILPDRSASLYLGGSDGTIEIGDGTELQTTMISINTGGVVRVGEDCMLGYGSTLSQSDGHHIFDLHTRKQLNGPSEIVIGNHVWIGRGASILGGARIGDGSIIGAHAVTSSTFGKNVVAAGVPAKVIREDVIWARDLIKYGNKEDFSDCEDQAALRYL